MASATSSGHDSAAVETQPAVRHILDSSRRGGRSAARHRQHEMSYEPGRGGSVTVRA